MLGENYTYKFLVTVLVSAIVVSLIFHIFFRRDADEDFSEVFFPFPNKLPNDVNVGENHSYTFTVRNLEGKPSTYDYYSKLELFNLYDATEGIYKCSAKKRKKVSLGWIEGNVTASNIFLLNKTNNDALFLYSESDDYGRIDWPYYSIQYRYKNDLGEGSFTTVFHDKDNIKYSIILNADTSEAEFAYFGNGSVKKEIKKVENLKSDNEILINVSDSIHYSLNDELIFSKAVDNATGGKVDFRVDNTYALVGQMVVYKDSPIVVIHSEFIRDYDIDNSLIIEKINELREESEDDVYLVRNDINLTDACQGQDCDDLRLYVNNPQDSYFFESDMDIDETLLLSLINLSDSERFTSQSYLQNDSVNELFWENFTVRMRFQTFVKPHTILASFDDKFMMLFHDNDVYFVIKNDDGITIHRRDSLIEPGINEILLDSKNNNVVVSVNDFPMLNFKRNFNFKNISLYTKNTFVALDNIFASNRDESCKTFSTSENCRRTYGVQAERQVVRSNQPRAIADPIKISAGLSLSPFLGVLDLFDYEEIADEFINDSEELAMPSVLDFLNYEIEINPELINEEIPSEKYAFDGSNAKLKNQLNYSFSFDFTVFGGLGLMEVSFSDDDSKIVSFILNKPENEAYILADYGGTLFKYTADVNVAINDMHKLDIIHEANKTSYYLNRKKIFETYEIDMSNGYFSISTFNTHFDIRDISLYDRNLNRRNSYYINNDPCRLRRIDEVEIGSDSLFLDSNENATIKQNFVIRDDFDYGLVSINLEPEFGNKTEIHFWVVRNE